MVNLRTQRRLAGAVLKAGRGRVWLAPEKLSEIKSANSRQAIRKLIKDHTILKRAVETRSRGRWRKRMDEKKRGRHLGAGKVKGTKEARKPSKDAWMLRQRIQRRLLAKYRQSGKIDCHLYQQLYRKAKGNVFKSKKVLLENIFLRKAEIERENRAKAQRQALLAKQKRAKDKRALREERRSKRIRAEAEEAAKLLKKAMSREKEGRSSS